MEQSAQKPKTKLIFTQEDLTKSLLQYLIATPDLAQYLKFIKDEDLDPKNCLHYPDFEHALHDYQQLMLQGVAARIIMLEPPKEVLDEMRAEFKKRSAKT